MNYKLLLFGFLSLGFARISAQTNNEPSLYIILLVFFLPSELIASEATILFLSSLLYGSK